MEKSGAKLAVWKIPLTKLGKKTKINSDKEKYPIGLSPKSPILSLYSMYNGRLVDFENANGITIIIKRITIIYLIFKKELCVFTFNVLFFEGIAAQASWIVPIGHIHPQKNLFENKMININNPIRNIGRIPSVIKKKVYSRIPAPVENGFLGEFRMGNILINPFKLFKLIEKISSRIK